MNKFVCKSRNWFIKILTKKSNLWKHFNNRKQINWKKIYNLISLTKTKDLLKAMHKRVFNNYKLSNSIVNDWKNQIILKLWQRICKKYDIKSKLSITYHSKINKQTKNANKIMKNYFKVYVQYTQNNWMNFLPNVKFATNSHENAFDFDFCQTKLSFQKQSEISTVFWKWSITQNETIKNRKNHKTTKIDQVFFRKKHDITHNN